SNADAERMTMLKPGNAQVVLPGSIRPLESSAHPPVAGRRGWVATAALVLVDTVMVAASFYTSWAVRYQAEIGPEIEDVNYVPFAVFAPLILVLVPITLLLFAA